MSQQAVLGAIAVVVHDNKVLLAKRRKDPDSGLWGFPGGHVELGETALAAAARELNEETTIRATPVRYLTNVDVLRFHPDGSVAVHFLLAAVLCKYVSGTARACDDVSDAQWFDCDAVRAKSINMSDQVAEIMDLACACQS